MDRFEFIYTAKYKIYYKNIKLTIENLVILHDKINNNYLLLIKFMNLSDSAINAVKIKIETYNVFEQHLDDYEHLYTNINVNKGQVFGEKNPINISYTEGNEYVIILEKILYEDKKIDNIIEEKIVFEKPVPLKNLITDETIYNEFLITYPNFQEYYMSSKKNDFWICVCGTPNLINDYNCAKCSSVFLDINNSLLDNLNEKIIKRKKEEEVLREIEEKRAELERVELEKLQIIEQIKRRKQRKKAALILLFVSVIIISIYIYANFLGNYINKNVDTLKLLESKGFEINYHYICNNEFEKDTIISQSHSEYTILPFVLEKELSFQVSSGKGVAISELNETIDLEVKLEYLGSLGFNRDNIVVLYTGYHKLHDEDIVYKVEYPDVIDENGLLPIDTNLTLYVSEGLGYELFDYSGKNVDKVKSVLEGSGHKVDVIYSNAYDAVYKDENQTTIRGQSLEAGMYSVDDDKNIDLFIGKSGVEIINLSTNIYNTREYTITVKNLTNKSIVEVSIPYDLKDSTDNTYVNGNTLYIYDIAQYGTKSITFYDTDVYDYFVFNDIYVSYGDYTSQNIDNSNGWYYELNN